MSDEAKAKIAESVRKSFEAKRLAKGDTIAEAAKAIGIAPEIFPSFPYVLPSKIVDSVSSSNEYDNLTFE